MLVCAAAATSIVGATLLAALLNDAGGGGSAPPAAQTAPARSAASVDLSTMTPREAADRLFNRVMSASEAGDNQEALQFAPMAVQAYDRVANLDADGHYHVGLLLMLQGDLDGVRERVMLIRQHSPQHLFATVLEHDIAERSGDTAAAARAVTAFAATYKDELAAARPEYEPHAAPIERLRTAAAGL